jgi:hypothetical protein
VCAKGIKFQMVCLKPGYIIYASIADFIYAVNYSLCHFK